MSQTLMTEGQAAQILDVVPKTMQAWRCRGGGPRFYKIGRLCRYKQSDLEEFLEGRHCDNTAQYGRKAKRVVR